MSLTPSQEKFAAGVAGGLNQSEAYRQAYPRSKAWKSESVWQKSSVLMRDVKVRSRVKELTQKAAARHEISVERVLKEVARLALFDPRQLYDADGNPVPIHELDDDTAAAIAGLDVLCREDDDGKTSRVLKYKIADKNSALEKLMKHLGLYEKDNEQQGAGLAAALLSARKRIRS